MTCSLTAYFADLRASAEASRPWHIREALRAADYGHYHPILQRGGDQIYLMRYWLSEPQVKGDEDRWESADSLLLHHLLLPDDCTALHDHPWPFRTTILTGSYAEYLPPAAWLGHVDQPGPPPTACQMLRSAGTSIDHAAADLHAIGRVQPNTWSLVRTGSAVRRWGFHPHNQPWMDGVTYLGTHPTKQAKGDAMTNVDSMTSLTLADYIAQARAQGVSWTHVAMVCPICRTIQSATDLIAAGAGADFDAVEKYLGFSCVGRFTGKRGHKPGTAPGQGCDWTLGGLFKVHSLEVVTPDGQRRPRFRLATPDEAQAHAAGLAPAASLDTAKEPA